MFCGNCKNKISKRRSRNFISIYCPFRNETSFLCLNDSLYKYEELEELILNSIRKEFDIYFKENNLNSHIMKKYNMTKINEIDNKLKELNKELEMLKFRVSKLYNDRLQENISEENYKKSYNELTDKRKQLVRYIQDLEGKKIEINTNKGLLKIEEIQRILKKLDKNTLTEEEIGKLISKIYINKNYIHIFYKFKKYNL